MSEETDFEICTVCKRSGRIISIGGTPFIPGVTPKAWLVRDDKGLESVYLDHTRAQQYAAEHHGTVIGLVTQRI